MNKTTDMNLMRPYEKCINMGADSMTDEELLAAIIKTGTKGIDATSLSKRVIDCSTGNNGILGIMGMSIHELMQIKGIGQVKAIQIRCICELSRRIAKARAYERLDFGNPAAIADYYMEDMRHHSKERLIAAFLDSKCRLIQDKVISVGTVNASLITPREVFIEAMRYGAVAIVLLHNHPSGDATPSKNDLVVTQRIKEAGELLGIQLIDHIIIGDNNYSSMKQSMIL